MKVAVNLIHFGPGLNPTILAGWARLAEELGYHGIALSDHLAVTPDVQAQYPTPFYEPFISLAWLAGITQTIRVGTTVNIVPYRHPLEVARMTANLDQMSGGRLILGVGVGWARQEFAALDIPFHQRGAITDDYLAAIKTLWTSDVATYQGRFVSFESVDTRPRPVQSPHPPIWVGGSSDAALLRAVRFGNGWHPLRVRVERLENAGLPRLQRIADAEKRPRPALCPRIKLHLTESRLDDGDRLAGQGTLAQVHKDLEALQSLGAEYVLLDTYRDDPATLPDHERAWRMLTTLAEQVLDLEKETVK